MATSLADTSGTVGQTVVDVAGIIEHAVRRCGVLASLITSEQLESARENLFFILSSLATRGLSLWCVQQTSVQLTQGVATYSLPVGTVDVLNGLLSPGLARVGTVFAPGSDPTFFGGAGFVQVDLSAPGRLDAVAILPSIAPPATSASCVLFYSNDGVVWTQWSSVIVEASAEFQVLKVNLPLTSARYWRASFGVGANLATAGNFFANTRDVVTTKLNRDSYVSLPDKMSQAQLPLQYWYDKQQSRPQVTFWPAPSELKLATFFIQRQIQDPGPYTKAVAVPQRWLDAVISLLAPRVCLELPKELVPPDRYDKLVLIAEKTLREAEDSETDGAPIRMAPRIGCYTR